MKTFYLIKCLKKPGKYFTRGLLSAFLLLISVGVYPQRVYSQGVPDADKIIASDEILEELVFDHRVIDSMRYIFHNVPGTTTFALKRQLNYKPGNSGRVINNHRGERVWYLRIRSEGAMSLNIIFSNFSLLKGEQVYVYDNMLQSVKGPFTSDNNKMSGSLAVMPVAGEEIIIEYHLKAGGEEGRLEIGQVSHDFIGIAGPRHSKDIYYGSSQPCNVDINCTSGSNWQTEKNSIVRIIAGGTELGSGFLVNNTRGENIPFVITANHVIRTPQFAVNSIYLFRYESRFCDGPDGPDDYSLSGAELMAEDENMDFTLVRLDEFPPVLYRPYLAGWDVRNVVPENTVTIHHPSGDVKKISTDLNPPIIATFQDLRQNGFWKILEWDEGTTEGGSSGSPLFNQDKRVVGLLTGGEAVCGNSVNDYFARLDIAYDLNSGFYNSLMPWLDPARLGVEVFDGRDPYEEIKTGFDTLSNCAGDERYLTKYELPGTGYTTGFNSDSLIMYAEKFSLEAGRELAEVIMEIGDSRMINNSDSITIYIMSGITEPETVLARRTIYLREARDSTHLSFDFVTPVPLPQTVFVAWHLWYTQAASAEQQQLAIFHGAPVSPAENTAYFKDMLFWYPFNDHPYQPEPLNMCVQIITADSIVYSQLDTVPGDTERAVIYPNPATDKLSIKIFDNTFSEVRYSIIDNTGKKVRQGSYYAGGAGSVQEIDISSLSHGMYFLILQNGYSYSVHKLVRK
ncbi:MAG: trypsin-like peptidase domain-containing protein [Bacteroidales bacterium]|nr:trypsin-like peptidase domain-containing protein [Bacteroidales bacterium]